MQNVKSVTMPIFINQPKLILFYLVLKYGTDSPLCDAFNSLLNPRSGEISCVSTPGQCKIPRYVQGVGDRGFT